MTKAVLLPAGFAVMLSLGALTPQAASAQSTKTWDHLSTGLAFGLGGAAVLATYTHSDETGFMQGLKTAGATFLAVEALKSAVHERRPDGSDNRGFPSGHTALAFAAATYFNIRYGQQYPSLVPVMYGAAALTGIARVEAKKHYAQDVLAGAAIGFGLAHVFTTPMATQVSMAPTGDGMALTYTKRF